MMAHQPQAAVRDWQPDDEPLVCVQVRRESADVKTFVFAPPAPRRHVYLPGQFITLDLTLDGERVNRCYTLSSTPTRPERVAITVKRVPGGRVSNWLHDHLKVGDQLPVLGPAGGFSCFAAPGARYAFIAGGSGITPLLSMTRALHDLASEADVVFVQAARTPDDLLFTAELTEMARTMPHLRLAWLCEQQPPGSAHAGVLGRIDGPLLARLVPDIASRDVYCCGPAPFMAAVRGLLAAVGFDMARYREESFTFDAGAAPAGPPVQAGAAATWQVTATRSGKSFACRSDQTLLEAARAAGVPMAFSCRSGLCGTCKTRKTAGEVDMQHQGGIRPREVAAGLMLPCCSRPLSDVTLEC